MTLLISTKEENIGPDYIKKEIRDYWDRTKEHAFFKDEEEEQAWMNTIKEEFGTEKLKILDVGTGNGSLALVLASIGHDVVGIDISEGMLSVAKKKAKERGVDPDLRIGDAESLEFDDEYFDAVVSRIVLWTLPDPKKAISEWRRVLKPGGKVYTFEIESWGRRKGTYQSIMQNLGLFLITITEQKNAWKTEHYSKDVNASLPISYDKSSSSAVNKVELFRKGGFDDVSVFKMDKVSDICRKKQEEVPLRYKITWGNSSDLIWYYIKGCKT